MFITERGLYIVVHSRELSQDLVLTMPSLTSTETHRNDGVDRL